MKTNRIVPLLGLLLVAVAPAAAQEAATKPATTTNTVPAGAGLPQAQGSKEQLNAFMAMLLEKDRANGATEMSKSPTAADGNFIRVFEGDFVVARRPGFAAVIHAGPLGAQAPDGNTGPMGMGGGQLSAFWTPGTGPVILCLRGGMTVSSPDSWLNVPIHAVSCATDRNMLVATSAGIAKPQVVADVKNDGATVTVSGPLVGVKVATQPGAAETQQAGSAMYDEQFMSHAVAESAGGPVNYARTFKITDKGVRVETTVSGEGQVSDEIFETIPVYLGAGQEQKVKAAVKIEHQRGGKWVLLTEAMIPTKAIRVTRFGHAVMVTFDKQQRVGLAPAEWTDLNLNKYAACRNLVITLRQGGEFALGTFIGFSRFGKERKIFYEITPVEEPAQSQPEAK